MKCGNSKLAIVLMLNIFLSACATQTGFGMQPDSSYRIEVGGNGFTSLDRTKKEAYKQADALCPKGYDVKAERPQDNFHPAYSLIVMCKS